ncbi:MAG: type II toxin-antitoxin system prevent-host-death family antitoxin [Aphanizomenon flos-aquae DEX188]|jgi:antitoxin (DNA-binding transcriptional repressor) of toxin-antitoxin stability system|nr:type II toxin-antitoxin system prevent-host-death family antitoxin [Nostocales cyanobacterium W4_Combined_metabat2_030]QSV66766.1 MAG: type II toxin-antitoxin system prevent-host-death family antitoxin [Aphanizomenon flos-aquae DEX188]
MSSIEITQAIKQISKLFHLALNGEEIIITENHQPLLKLTALKSKSQRLPLFGTDKDIISIADNFDAPLEEFEN